MDEPSWQGKPKHPIREVLTWLCGKPPPKFVQGYDLRGLSDVQSLELQEWAVQQLDKTKIPWATGIGMLDAAEAIVEEAVGNGNIPAADSKWRTDGTPASAYEKKKRRVTVKTKKNVRGFTLMELSIVVLLLGIIGVSILYGLYKWIGGQSPLDTAPMAQKWATGSGYTWQSSTCRVFGLTARCTVKVAELSYPVSLDCNQASEQCSLTPMGRQ
jgi:prepilin-type N-terminal cleavage/methylation domain-containing protein